jgi:hypothetical protein
MIVTYKGYKIDVKREKSVDGDTYVYTNLTRLVDGYLLIGSFEHSVFYSYLSVRDIIKDFKKDIDDFIKGVQTIYNEYLWQEIEKEDNMTVTFTNEVLDSLCELHRTIVEMGGAPVNNEKLLSMTVEKFIKMYAPNGLHFFVGHQNERY